LIIKYSFARLFIIILFVILFPLVQKQWLNLYLFDIGNFSIYKILYYLSGLICPSLVIINSIDKFTFYKFKNKKINNYNIGGKSLLLLTISTLIIFSIFISEYIFLNLKIFSYLFFSDNTFFVDHIVNKKILFVMLTFILLLFNNLKLFIKKVSLINFFLISIFVWYSEIISNIQFNDNFFKNIFILENISYTNIIFLLSIEILYYLWSYISYGSHLSDWLLPIPIKKYVSSILYIITFYLFIILYYSIFFRT